MAGPSKDNALDHVVVIMFENRSFDNLLGRLYEPGEVRVVRGRARQGAHQPDPGRGPSDAGGRRRCPTGSPPTWTRRTPTPARSTSTSTPSCSASSIPPPTAACWPTRWSPRTTRRLSAQRPTMDGFVADYISAFTAEIGRQPTLRRVRPDHDRLHARADAGRLGPGARVRHLRPLVLRGAVADLRQPVVLPRRAPRRATSSTCSPPDSFPVHNTAETLFERLESKGLTWRVYCDPPSHVSFTGLIHAARLYDALRRQLLHHRPVPPGRRARATCRLLVHRAQHAARPQRHAPGRSTPSSPA